MCVSVYVCVYVMTLLSLVTALTSFAALCFNIKKIKKRKDSYTKCPNKCIKLEISLAVCVCVCVCV